jgi:hypothetical protein
MAVAVAAAYISQCGNFDVISRPGGDKPRNVSWVRHGKQFHLDGYREYSLPLSGGNDELDSSAALTVSNKNNGGEQKILRRRSIAARQRKDVEPADRVA